MCFALTTPLHNWISPLPHPYMVLIPALLWLGLVLDGMQMNYLQSASTVSWNCNIPYHENHSIAAFSERLCCEVTIILTPLLDRACCFRECWYENNWMFAIIQHKSLMTKSSF